MADEDLNFDFPDDEEGHNPLFAFFIRDAAEHVIPTLMELYVDTVQKNPRAATRTTQKEVVKDILFFIEEIASGMADMMGEPEEEDEDADE